MKTFTGNEIHTMNKKYPWNNSIKNTALISQSYEQYCLYPTGNCNNSNGREYVYLKADIKLTQELKEFYNIL
tara:strand:- start:2133 stop:2348 length:216 start_codon:yes stop_codon:yes gene_type:complete